MPHIAIRKHTTAPLLDDKANVLRFIADYVPFSLRKQLHHHLLFGQHGSVYTSQALSKQTVIDDIANWGIDADVLCHMNFYDMLLSSTSQSGDFLLQVPGWSITNNAKSQLKVDLERG